MARYILIDNNSGYIFADTADLNGPARDETAIEAVRRFDVAMGEHSRTYEEHGAHYRLPSNETAYHVYRADVDGAETVPLVYDGQSHAEIAAVEKHCRKVAVVLVRSPSE
jgi:hypothetical protein